MQVLENCSRVLDNLSSEEYSISGKCNVAKSTLIDSLVQKYKESFQDFFQEVSVIRVLPRIGEFCGLPVVVYCRTVIF